MQLAERLRPTRARWLNFWRRLVAVNEWFVAHCGRSTPKDVCACITSNAKTLRADRARSRPTPSRPRSGKSSVPLLYMCFCACHADSKIVSFIPADLEDAIAAATACDSCRDSHCLALLPTRLANDPEPEKREKFEWVDDGN